MPSIITITFSPCIDKSTSVRALIPKKKLQCATPKLEPGGGGINVARAIKKLGGEATAIFPSGGYTGNFFNHLLDKKNISFIIIKTNNETRQNAKDHFRKLTDVYHSITTGYAEILHLLYKKGCHPG